MLQLEPPDTHYLNAASGWLELGNPAEAEAELNNLSAAALAHPDVLEMRWMLHAQRGRWEQCLHTAEKLMEVDPSRPTGWLNHAYALRRIPGGSVKEAREALLPAYQRFPSESIIPFNLACYSCQLGDMEAARMWLRRAIASGGSEAIKKMARADEDLQPLWSELDSME